MPEGELRDVIDGIRARLQAELESQLGTLSERHDQAIEEARHAAEQAAEEAAESRWAPRVDATRAEWAARLESELAAARSEVERTMVAELMRVRVEAEQQVAESASEARRELEQVVGAERQRAQAQADVERERAARELTEARAAFEAERTHTAEAIEEAARWELEQVVGAERQRAQAQADVERERAARELTEARAAFEAERAHTAETIKEGAADVSSLLEAVRAIDRASSLSDALAAAVRGAAAEAPRAALFLVTGQDLAEWPVGGVPPLQAGPIRVDGRDAGILGEAVRRSETIWTGPGGNGTTNPPAFAALADGSTALASPVVLAGQPVAVLYADDGVNGDAPAAWSGDTPKAWRDTVQILARHATAAVAYLTAVRTAQAMQTMQLSSPASPAAFPTEEDQGARRYARLLVSEIKLYNEGAVRMGRERGDLLQRLKPEIDRARVLYDERISVSIASRDIYFRQELLQTLADGDLSLLGSP